MPRARGFTVVPRDPRDPGCRFCDSSVPERNGPGGCAVAVTRSKGENASQWNRVGTQAAGKDITAAPVGCWRVHCRMGCIHRHRLAKSSRRSRGHRPARGIAVRHGPPARDVRRVSSGRIRHGPTAAKDRLQRSPHRHRSRRRRSRSHPRRRLVVEGTSRVDRRATESSTLRRGGRARSRRDTWASTSIAAVSRLGVGIR